MRRSGRTKATTAVDDRYLRISARRNPESNATVHSTLAIRYSNDIPQPIVKQYRQTFGEEFVFMGDNSLPHRAHLVNEFLHDNNIARLEWPACSPDMHPIGHA